MQLINHDLPRYGRILSKYDRACGKSVAKDRTSTKRQQVSTANERGLTSQAAFLFASEPRLSFHDSFSREPHTECPKDTRLKHSCVFLSALLFLSFFSSLHCRRKKINRSQANM